jgi:ketosteroid isomerase-like protein
MQPNTNASISLPPPVAAYFAADTTDVDRVVRCFTESAVVVDEQPEHRGHLAIARWKADATAKYHYSSVPIAVDLAGPTAIVTARVAGDFPGSPVELRYRFALEGDRIARLEIAP